MANETQKSATGPFRVEDTNADGGVLVPVDCPPVPPPEGPDPAGPWVPGFRCYNNWPEIGHAIGGAMAHYGYYLGEPLAPPLSVNPVAGLSWPQVTVFFACKGRQRFEGFDSNILRIGYKSLEVTQHWAYYGGNNSGWQLWEWYFGHSPDGSEVKRILKGSSDPFLTPADKWCGHIISVDFTTAAWHYWLINFEDEYELDFSSRISAEAHGLGAGVPLKFASDPLSLNGTHWWAARDSYSQFSETAFPSPSKVLGQPKGCLAQVGFHPGYLDLTKESNRRKVFCIDGLKDLGRLGEKVFGERMAYFSENSDPLQNAGYLNFVENGRLSYYHPGDTGGTLFLGSCGSAIDLNVNLFGWWGFNVRNDQNSGQLLQPADLDPVGHGIGFQPQNTLTSHAGRASTIACRIPAGTNKTLKAVSSDPDYNTDAKAARGFCPSGSSFEGAVWIRPHPDGLPAYQTFFSVGDENAGTRSGYQLGIEPNGDANEHQVRFRARSTSGDTIIHSARKVRADRWSLVQWGYDRVQEQMRLRVNTIGDPFVSSYDLSTPGTTPPDTPNTRASVGGDYNSVTFTSSNQYQGRVDEKGFWTGILSQEEADEVWNDGWGKRSDLAVEAPSYRPAARVLNAGASGSGKTDYYVCPATVSGNQFTMVGRTMFGLDRVTGVRYVVARTDVTNNFMARLDSGPLLKCEINGKGTRQLGFPTIHTSAQEQMLQWLNFLFSYDGATNKAQFWLWMATQGWINVTGGTWSTWGSSTFLSPTSTVGGPAGFITKECWLSHFGVDSQFIDFSVAANRDKFFNDDGTPRQLDESGWTEWGGQPLVWAPDGDLVNHLGTMAAWTTGGSTPAVALTHAADPV